MTTTINFVIFLIATTCCPHHTQENRLPQKPISTEITQTDDALSNSFDVDDQRLRAIGNIA